MRLVPGDIISDCIAFTGVYEPAQTRRLLDLANRGGTLVEVGANLGYFTLLWTAAASANDVTAFEASPRNISLLGRNIEENGFRSRIRLAPVAAGRTAGTLPFDPGPVDQTGWGGLAPATESAISVAVVRVDEIVSSSDPIALLKVDVEGADAWVLEGCDKLLRSQLVREVWFEQNRPRMQALGIDPSAAQDYLHSVGYTCTPSTDPDGSVVDWMAVPRGVRGHGSTLARGRSD
jgi:FkbM family methyltransferase